MIATKFSKILLSIAVLTATSISHGADEPNVSETALNTSLQISIDQQQEIESFQNRLAELESEFGVYDQRLLEILQGLTDVLIAAGDYEEVDDVLERRLLLLRTINGPENLDQLPIVIDLISNDIRLQDWQSVIDRYEYIYRLHSQDDNVEPSTLLQAKSNLVDWLLSSIYFDNSGSRVSRFMDARQHHREALSLAEDLYPENSPELIPWLYRHAKMQHHVYAFLKSDDEVGYDARYEISRVERRTAENYLREGLNTVKWIRRIVDAHDDPETQAMAMIAEADFQMLLSLGTAARLYRSAAQKLEEAGIAVSQIEAFFLKPAVLPLAEFHFSLQSLLDAQDYQLSNSGAEIVLEDNAEDELLYLGDFFAWSQSLPFSQRPNAPDPVTFTVSGLNAVEMVFSINSRGKSSNPKVIQAVPDQGRVKRDSRDAVREVQFRPRFVDGRWRRVDNVSMRYLYVPP
jgi:hypothetical protein